MNFGVRHASPVDRGRRALLALQMNSMSKSPRERCALLVPAPNLPRFPVPLLNLARGTLDV